MKEKKDLYIANFNCTFGKDNIPMLYHFKDIIFPAFKNEVTFKNKRNGNEYLFENVHLTINNGIFTLVGLIVKKTYLEIKSRYDEQGELKNTNERIPSDPYSYFIINLENHRMALVKNQKGSPTVNDFDNTASYLLKSYVNDYNDNISKEEKLPEPNLNVVTIPFSGKIEEELKKVKKIINATLRFYPLNGDISPNSLFNELRNMLEDVESKSGNTQINNPKNHQAVGNILKDTKGLVKPTLKVAYDNGAERTLRDTDFSEKRRIEIDDELDFRDNINIISGKVINDTEYNETSDENKKIYHKFFGVLENLLKNK